jgi:glycosyltransferase involved in cell wall biosynthesis
MKVHLYGNTLNSAYHLTIVMRAKGIDAILFLDQSSVHQQDYPWWDDPSVTENNLPSWIKYYKTFPFFLLPNKETKRMIKDFADCDIALVSCYGPMLAMKAKVPFVFYSLGSDLKMISIKKDLAAVFFDSQSLKDKIRKLIKIVTYSPLQRKAIIKGADRIIIYMGYQYHPFITANHLENKTHKLCYPKDVLHYGVSEDKALQEKYSKYKIVYFMFSRHSWFSVWNEYKGNDKFIRAFARFVKENNPNVLLISTNKGIDIKRTKKIVSDEKIDSFVEWVDDMPKYLLKKYQSIPNVVMVDNFWHNRWFVQFPEDKHEPKVGFGFGGIESLASKRPLITAFKDEEFYGGNTPPVLFAFTEEEIYQRIKQSYQMTIDELKQMGEIGYNFALQWHEQTRTIDTHIDILKEVIATKEKNKKR